MRWRLGRSTAKKKAAKFTPRGADVAPTNRSSSTSTTTAAAGIDWQRSGSSPEVHEATIEADGANFYCATASCGSLRRRSANSAHANGARLRTNDNDSLTSSLVSFVEGVASQPRRQSSSAEDTHCSPCSPSCDAGPDNGASVSCGGGDNNALLVGGSVDGSVDESVDSSRSNPAVAAATAGTATSSSPTTGRASTTQEDLLIAEVHDYLLRRGGVDRNTAAVAARMSLALTLSREPTLGVIQDTRPANLVSLARGHLDLSAGASSCLLNHLVENWTTVARFITAGADLDKPHLRQPLSGSGRVHNGAVQGGEKSLFDCLLLHRAGTQAVDRALSMTETLAASGAEAAEAATILYEACRTWRDIVEAINNNTMIRTSEGPLPKRERGRGDDADAARTRATRTRVSPGGMKDERGNVSPPDSTWLFCSLESRRGQCRPHLGSSNGRSTPATAVPTAIVEGTGESREEGQQDRVSHHLRQAIRVVTSGARKCYGQLVVLGYKEFLVRDSTWHRVGHKNARFALTKREAPNGVHVGDHSSSSGGGIGEGKPDSNNNGIRIVHENNVVPSTLYCQADSNSNKTTIGDPVCSTPTYNAPAENDDEDDTNETRNGAGCGHPSDFKTPEPRPNGMVSDSCGGRNPAHRRGRGGSGAGNANSGATGGGNGGRRGCDAGEKRDGGGRHCFSSNRLGSGRDVAAGVVAREIQHRMQLLLSAEQRGAAESSGVWRTSETRAAATGAAAVAAGEERGDDVVNIACSAIDGCDMYQLGRMEGAENDFAVRGPLHQSKPGGKVCGPVSRYAFRLLVDRAPPHRCRIFAGGFNSRKCLMLPRSSPKWLEEDGEWDAVTPFGVRVLKPEVGEWREVTVAGAVRQPRVGHLHAVGALMRDESNELTDGTVIDVGGVQILYESAETMSRLGGVHPSRVVELLNSRKPQCPIQLQTLRFKPWQPPPAARPPETGDGGGAAANGTAATPGGGVLGGDAVSGGGTAAALAMDIEDEGENTEVEGDDDEDNEAKSLVPHVFPACGHVQGYAKQLAWGPCPMCRTPGPLVEVKFGWCPAIDREEPTVVFNPCGHAASLEVAERWARLAMPNNAPPDAVYRPICPYCAKPLQCKNGERPYSKMIFAR